MNHNGIVPENPYGLEVGREYEFAFSSTYAGLNAIAGKYAGYNRELGAVAIIGPKDSKAVVMLGSFLFVSEIPPADEPDKEPTE